MHRDIRFPGSTVKHLMRVPLVQRAVVAQQLWRRHRTMASQAARAPHASQQKMQVHSRKLAAHVDAAMTSSCKNKMKAHWLQMTCDIARETVAADSAKLQRRKASSGGDRRPWH